MMDRNMNAINFGLRNRDMSRAGGNAIKDQVKAGQLSYATGAAYQKAWADFAKFSKETLGYKDMRHITVEHGQRYGQHLKSQVEAGIISKSTAHNKLSVFNRVMSLARGDSKVRVDAVKDKAVDMPKRSHVATASKAMSSDNINKLKSEGSERLQAVAGLQEQFGLRIKESILINAQAALKEAEQKGAISVSIGTKGGRPREIPLSKNENLRHEQIKALEKASAVQGTHYSLAKAGESYIKQNRALYKEVAQTLGTGGGMHGIRHAYAQRRYAEITQVKSPVEAGVKHGPAHYQYIVANRSDISTIAEAKEVDKAARQEIARELGHNRLIITNNYLG